MRMETIRATSKGLKRASVWLIGCLVLAILLMADPVGAEEAGSGTAGQQETYPWHLTLYTGVHAQSSLRDVYTFQAKFPDDTYVAVAALARDIYQYKHKLRFELEGQVAKHFGKKEDHWEFVGLVIFRWLAFPWDKTLDTSLAIGEGFSYYTEVSAIELEEDPDAQKLLNYLLLEATFGLPKYPRWDLSLRIHHRSGVFGLVGEAGANFLCAGIRYSF